MLNIENSIVLIIDIQEKLKNAVADGNQICENASKLSKASDILDIPTIITEQYPKGLGKTDISILNNIQNAKIIEKSNFSAYSDIKEELSNLGRKQVILCGIEAHICVLQTAFDLIQNGYEVYLMTNGISSRKIQDLNIAIRLMKDFGVKETTLEIILFQWIKSSKHEKFKEIQSLIK